MRTWLGVPVDDVADRQRHVSARRATADSGRQAGTKVRMLMPIDSEQAPFHRAVERVRGAGELPARSAPPRLIWSVPCPRASRRWLVAVARSAPCCPLGALPAQTDLDAFMQQVVARRDDNWKKLQQYILDEREQLELRGPTRVPIWGERRDYTWYIRDGFFVRSPVKFNGVDDRRGRAPEVRGRLPQAGAGARQARAARRGAPTAAADGGADATERRRPTLAQDVGGLIRQTRQPQFISSAYFLRFKFEEGKYALVGRETLDGRDVLRIEYYPTRHVRRHRSPAHAASATRPPTTRRATPSSSG